jgi:glycosyltransferase involved in cell wall biosynthesis
MERAIVYDLTRLFLGPLFATPRGIDRVDLLLANHFTRVHRSNFLGLLPTPCGARVYDAEQVESGLRRLEELWAETTEATNDPLYAAVVEALTGDSAHRTVKRNNLNVLRRGRRLASLLSSTGIRPGRSAIGSVPANSIYLNVGHYTLAVPFSLAWLNKRRDVKAILMLHDTIPLDRPELVPASGVRSHQQMVRSAAKFAAGLIVTTRHARETVLQALAAEGRFDVRVLSIALPLAESFDAPLVPNPLLDKVPYFVVCGTITPRKNHLLLLDVWRRLSTSARPTPHLVVVGSVGWRGREILGQMLGCEATRGHIHHVEGLSTQAMKSLIAHSRALLSPTHAEGFGLPIVEALHLGATVIASDIPAHREVAGEKAILLDPTDALKWRATIETIARQMEPQSFRPLPDARQERKACFDLVDQFIGSF